MFHIDQAIIDEKQDSFQAGAKEKDIQLSKSLSLPRGSSFLPYLQVPPLK